MSREGEGAANPPARPALLLLGPTGSGKSPLGRALERQAGWPHLDFGAELRRVAAGQGGGDLDPGERAFVCRLIAAQALFPDDALPLVRRLVAGALRDFGSAGPVVLNGIPRTVAQARGIADLVAVHAVVTLVAPPEVVRERIAHRVAGRGPDDSGRDDDTPAAVERKLELFERATRPLVALYVAAGATIVEVPVSAGSDPESQARDLVARLG